MAARIVALVVIGLIVGIPEARPQNQAPTAEAEALERCIGMVERGTATMKEALSMLRREAPQCPNTANVAPRNQALLDAVEKSVRARLSDGVGRSACAPIEVVFDGLTVTVKGQASNRAALDKAAGEIRTFLPDVKIDLSGVDWSGCRKQVPGTPWSLMMDDGGAFRRFTLDQAKAQGNVFPDAEECGAVGPAVAPLLGSKASDRRIWVWSQVLGGPIYCLEVQGTWRKRDYQLRDGRGAVVLRAQ